MTLNNRLDTAAAAMVNRIIIRSKPRALLPVLPSKKGSIGEAAMMARTTKEKFND